MDCTAGGVGPGGDGPGLGGPGSPRTGPKATLRYAAGGAGHPGLPVSADWNVALGLYWSHDYADGNAKSATYGTGGVWSFAFDDPVEPTVTTVTPPVGDDFTYTLERDTVSENTKVLQVSGDCPVCKVGPNAQLSYDDDANPLLPTSITDARGTVTSFTYDAFGQVTERTETDGEVGLEPPSASEFEVALTR